MISDGCFEPSTSSSHCLCHFLHFLIPVLLTKQYLSWLVESGRLKGFSIVPSLVIQRKVTESDVMPRKGMGIQWKDSLTNSIFCRLSAFPTTYSTPNHVSRSHSSPQHTSEPLAASILAADPPVSAPESLFTTALSMLLYDISYLAYTQTIDVPLSQAVDVEQQNLHKAVACHTLSLPLLFTEVLVLQVLRTNPSKVY